jgi:VWFA-related protein
VLDVTVLDKDQHNVRDLTRDDFTIVEAGQLQTIRNFESFSDHPLPPSITKTSLQGTADLQRVAPRAPVTILVLDELNSNFEDAAFARTQIRKYLSSQPDTLKQPTSLLVATDSSFEQAQDYTLDRKQLLDSLAHLKAAYPFGLMRTGGSSEGRAIRFAQTLSSLQQIAQASAGHKGRKNIIWVGRGFTGIDLRDAPDHQVQLVKGAAERTLNLLRDAHVAVYTIDPTLSTSIAAQLNATSSETDDAAFAAETHNATDPFDGTVSFNTLAPETGGRAFALNNNIDEEIATSVQEGSSFYTLAYVPSNSNEATKPYRGITVRVNRPGLTVVTRRGYFATVPALPARSARQDMRATGFDMGTAVSSKMTYTGLGVLAGPAQETGSFIVQVSTNDITWASQPDGSSSANLVLAAVALDSRNRPIAKAANEVTARVGGEINLNSIPFTTLKIRLSPPPTTVRIRIVVRDSSSGQVGTADIALGGRQIPSN